MDARVMDALKMRKDVIDGGKWKVIQRIYERPVYMWVYA